MLRFVVWIVIVIVIVISGVTCILGVNYVQSACTVDIVVIDKYTVTKSSESDGRMTVKTVLMVDTEKETFENTDSIFFGKFNSMDVQRVLRIGDKHTVVVAGRRVPLFSIYRNIIRVVE
jgi:hypothetical protein